MLSNVLDTEPFPGGGGGKDDPLKRTGLSVVPYRSQKVDLVCDKPQKVPQ